ncbi:zinc finger protein 184-like isoform X2 [Periplaneta americana]|uniref:zinc finger protein 184-like isoform X2 n=1 Tax=Periplaneta americana TaxID=6978 RepID=UPI0037E98C57
MEMNVTEMKRSDLRLKFSCKFPGCRNRYYSHVNPSVKIVNKHFYRFPPESKTDVLNKWKKICNISEDANWRHFSICEDHFLQADFVNFHRERLNPGVFPKHLEQCLYRPIPNTNFAHVQSDFVEGCSELELSKYDVNSPGVNGIEKSEIEEDEVVHNYIQGTMEMITPDVCSKLTSEECLLPDIKNGDVTMQKTDPLAVVKCETEDDSCFIKEESESRWCESSAVVIKQEENAVEDNYEEKPCIVPETEMKTTCDDETDLMPQRCNFVDVQSGVCKWDACSEEVLQFGTFAEAVMQTCTENRTKVSIPNDSLMQQSHSEKQEQSNLELCDDNFLENDKLNQIETLTNRKAFKCEICAKCFTRQGHLDRHKRIHTGEKPFRCETCGRNFTLEHHLRNHTKTQHKEAAVQDHANSSCDTSGGIPLTKEQIHTNIKLAEDAKESCEDNALLESLNGRYKKTDKDAQDEVYKSDTISGKIPGFRVSAEPVIQKFCEENDVKDRVSAMLTEEAPPERCREPKLECICPCDAV